MSAAFANSAEAALLLALFFVAAAFSMLPTTRALLLLWTSDPLRSFGSLLPCISLALTVRAWHSLGWRIHPQASGPILIAAAVLLSRASAGLLLNYRQGSFSFDPMQPALLLFLFFSGCTFLLGGKTLWRRSLFPLCLLLCVNPVPHFFSVWVDYPLQRLSADVARSFAHVLGLHPTGQQLQLMFTPRFGMEIIPGCNGMRGAATMAYGTLILCYLRGYRPRRIAAMVVAATLLGYLLNFLRLCLLDVYYAIGLNHPALRGDGALIDYCIGGCLFLLVSTLAGALWLGGGSTASPSIEPPVDWPNLLRHHAVLATAAFLAVASAIEVPAAHSLATSHPHLTTPETAFAAMPAHAGAWQRANTFTTEEDGGEPRWVWATYTAPSGSAVDFGIWLAPFQHFALRSRQVHGTEPLWNGAATATALHGVPVETADFVAEDDLQTGRPTLGYFAETTCIASRCTDHVSGFRQRGWSAAIGPAAMATTLRLPIQFRVRHGDAPTLSAAERSVDQASIRDLLSNIDTATLTTKLGFR